jgi:hypothetical protein
MNPPFDSEQNLRAHFLAGLERLLPDPGLGAYVLVLANAGLDKDIFALLKDPLERRFLEHADRCRRAFSAGRDLSDAADDLLVFLKLVAVGFRAIRTTELRRVGPWEVQFNLLRAFRPKRMSGSVGRGAQVPFDPSGFHFNKARLRRETLWRGRLAGRDVDLFYNKFPFIDYHGLLVPEREKGRPQFLRKRDHRFAWELTGELATGLPGVGLGYNSYGAYASVNHLHFQMFVRPRPLPLLDPVWRHNGGDQDYPAPCAVFDDCSEAWSYLDHLNREEEPYNLVYVSGRLHCLPRARQGNYRHAPWTGGFAWYEMAGGAIAFNREDYSGLNAAAISEELRRVGVAD